MTQQPLPSGGNRGAGIDFHTLLSLLVVTLTATAEPGRRTVSRGHWPPPPDRWGGTLRGPTRPPVLRATAHCKQGQLCGTRGEWTRPSAASSPLRGSRCHLTRLGHRPRPGGPEGPGLPGRVGESSATRTWQRSEICSRDTVQPRAPNAQRGQRRSPRTRVGSTASARRRPRTRTQHGVNARDARDTSTSHVPTREPVPRARPRARVPARAGPRRSSHPGAVLAGLPGLPHLPGRCGLSPAAADAEKVSPSRTPESSHVPTPRGGPERTRALPHSTSERLPDGNHLVFSSVFLN